MWIVTRHDEYYLYMEILAQRLKELRLERGVSLRTVAKVIGLNYKAYWFYEQNVNNPKPETIVKLAQYFGVTTDYLLGLSEY